LGKNFGRQRSVPLSSTDGNGGYWWQTTAGNWNPYNPGGYAPIDQYNPLAPITAGYWMHLVITYDSTRFISGTAYPYQYFINGRGDGFVWTGPGVNTTGFTVIGARGVFSLENFADRFFSGEVDEVAVYPRLLSGTEITNHFVARGIVIIPPSFSPALLSQTVIEGKDIGFSTTVLGTSPQLQWYKGASRIPGATNASYSIAGVATSDNGTYTLWATNSVGTNSTSATLTVFPPVGYANVTNDLVLHLRFDGDATDTSGRGNNGTPSNGTPPSSPAPAFVSGLIGAQALQYTTTTINDTNFVSGSFVRLGTAGSGPPTDLQFGASTSFTVGLWVRMTNSPGDLPFIGTATNGANNPGWILCPSYEAGGPQWGLNDGTNNFAVNGPDDSINDDAWHNFVLVVNRTTARAYGYLDGVLITSRDISTLGTVDNNNYWPINIGQDPKGTYPEAGSIAVDDIGIWRKALTSLEVASIASAGSTGGRSFDTVGPIPLSITLVGNAAVLSYGAGTLLESTNVASFYSPVIGASAPTYTTSPSGAAKYYRVQVQ